MEHQIITSLNVTVLNVDDQPFRWLIWANVGLFIMFNKSRHTQIKCSCEMLL